MKINWKLRLKNPTFWVFILSLLATNFAGVLNIELQNLTSWGAVSDLFLKVFSNPSILIPTLVTTYLGAVDFTTKGLGDTVETMVKKNTRVLPPQ